MPQNFRNAAEVRAAHPGVYDDLSDTQIEQGLQKQMGGGTDAPRPKYETDATDPTGKFLSLTQDPARYLGHAAKGLVRSPLDLVKGVLGIPGQVVKGLTQDLPALVQDPSLLKEIPGAVSDAASYANTHPEETGSFLGQTLLTPKVPGAVDATLAKGPGIVGRGVSAVGRGAEALGTSKLAKRGGTFGALGELLTGHPGAAAVTAVVPPALEYGGKALQKGGAALEGLDLSLKGRRPFSGTGKAEVDPAIAASEADTVRETVRTAREAEAGGASRKQAAARAGWPLGKSTEAPSYPNEPINTDLFPYQKESLAGARDAAKAKTEAGRADINTWLNDRSAQPDIPVVDKPYESADYAMDNAFTRARGGEPGPRMNDLAHTLPQSEAFKGLQDAVRRSGLSPVEKFYESDPQARTGGEGRNTGSFTEGSGGLADVANMKPYPMPEEVLMDEGGRPLGGSAGPLSPLDELSRLSGRAQPAARLDELLRKFGGHGT